MLVIIYVSLLNNIYLIAIDNICEYAIMIIDIAQCYALNNLNKMSMYFNNRWISKEALCNYLIDCVGYTWEELEQYSLEELQNLVCDVRELVAYST